MFGRTVWLKHGLWNILEHGLTRAADAATSLVLLWVLSPEIFSKLALAQAVIAPLLLFFVSPEVVLYRDFSKWQEAGISDVASRLHALRAFAWGKGQLALILSALVATLGADWTVKFWSLVWAFSLALAPQISGPDREFLRLNLQLSELNALSLYQKASLLGGTVFAALVFPNRIEILAAVAVFSTASTAVAARYVVRKSLRLRGASETAIHGREGGGVVQVISESLIGFSIWQHLNGVIVGWVQTMDLFFLGFLRFPARELGLYAAVLKLANFAIAIPLALANTFSLWIGRRSASSGLDRERLELLRLTGILLLGVAVQGVILYFLSPWIFGKLSHGRWSEAEQGEMLKWMKWILTGSSLFAAAWPAVSWLIVRSDIRRLFSRFYLPWGCISAGIYISMIQWKGLDGAALANVFVTLAYLGLLWLHFRRN
jgi:hypothetical protein